VHGKYCTAYSPSRYESINWDSVWANQDSDKTIKKKFPEEILQKIKKMEEDNPKFNLFPSAVLLQRNQSNKEN
jgi:hypothetical protein